MRYTTVMAEDEEVARDRLLEFARADGRLEVLGVAASGDEALEMVEDLRPALLLLDVHMPGLAGTDVLNRSRHQPAVIFTTADPAHALRAFDLGAVDYLLKPFGRERFRAAVDRLAARTGLAAPDAPPDAPLTRLFVRHRNAIVPVRMSDVVRLEAQDDYVLLHAPGGPYWVTTPLSSLEERLDASQFLRVHRSHIVSLEQIAALETHDARRLLVRMRDGAEIVASRQSSHRLRSIIA